MLLELYKIIYSEEAGSILSCCGALLPEIQDSLRKLVGLSSPRAFSRVLNFLSEALQ